MRQHRWALCRRATLQWWPVQLRCDQLPRWVLHVQIDTARAEHNTNRDYLTINPVAGSRRGKRPLSSFEKKVDTPG